MRFSTFYKERGDEVVYTRKPAWFVDFIPDKILITSLFTWDYDSVQQTALSYVKRFGEENVTLGGICASLMSNRFNGIPLHIGEDPELDSVAPDYSLFPELEVDIGYTSRGCPRSCGFCMVNKLETFRTIPEWRCILSGQHKKVIFWDNNFLATSREHQIDVLEEVRERKLLVDFNQGLDIAHLSDSHLDLFKDVRFSPLRFAFDSKGKEKAIDKGLSMLKENGFNMGNVKIYCLYGFKDDLQDALYRVQKLWHEYGALPFAMRYQPLDGTQKNAYTPENWDRFDYINFARWVNQPHLFKKMTYEQFKERVQNPVQLPHLPQRK